ncbi:MAG TPA: serine O-acetyltransferase [Arenibaculum sp.]|nr:serine O-acetyltransferase [Arenibaculum sp.]
MQLVRQDNPSIEGFWPTIREEAVALMQREPCLADMLRTRILNHDDIRSALAHHLANRLADTDVSVARMRCLLDDAYDDDLWISLSAYADLAAIRRRDAACASYLDPLLFFKGFLALQAYRVTHWYWRKSRVSVALMLQGRISEVFAADIHPAARIGSGIMIDHGTSVVIGETAVVEDDVSMLHEVTLGGTGKVRGDRHPKVRQGVMIGAGAKILGNVEVGRWARVGAGSVVIKDVPAFSTVVGVPARIVQDAKRPVVKPADEMDHMVGRRWG